MIISRRHPYYSLFIFDGNISLLQSNDVNLSLMFLGSPKYIDLLQLIHDDTRSPIFPANNDQCEFYQFISGVNNEHW